MTRYRKLVERYAGALDLSSPALVRSFDTAIERSLAYAPHLAGGRVLDLGSGVGLPGIPCAAARPDLEFVLCEVRKRRAAFLERAVSELGLANARVFAGDVRKYGGEPFDTVTSQAVGSLLETYELCRASLAPEWLILSRKGERAPADADQFRAAVPGASVQSLELGGGSFLLAARGSGPARGRGSGPARGGESDPALAHRESEAG